MEINEVLRLLSRSDQLALKKTTGFKTIELKNKLLEMDTVLRVFKERNKGKFESAKKSDLVHLNQLIEERLAEALQQLEEILK